MHPIIFRANTVLMGDCDGECASAQVCGWHVVHVSIMRCTRARSESRLKSCRVLASFSQLSRLFSSVQRCSRCVKADMQKSSFGSLENNYFSLSLFAFEGHFVEEPEP